MVDPIGIKTGVTGVSRTVSVGAAQKVAASGPVASEAPMVQSSAAGIASELAAKPPVDAERVARIKRAIEDGNFPLVPSTVADRLLALKMQWNPNEQA